MRLNRYFFMQFFPTFLFGSVLFLFVLVLDKLFDLLDLIFNKGIGISLVGKLFALIIPTVIPLTIPMACILACVITFGRLSEENELTAVRAAGISLPKAIWLVPVFSLIVSLSLIPLNTEISPRANKAFISTYEELIQSEPLINIIPKSFFAIKNIQLYAEQVSSDKQEMTNVFVYQISETDSPPQRIFARKGTIKAEANQLKLMLQAGQIEKYSDSSPQNILHTSFANYVVTIPLKSEEVKNTTTRFRNFTSSELAAQMNELKKQGFNISPIRAENHLRYALALAPFCLTFIGIPLATSLKKGNKSFGFGISIIVIFAYYLILIFGLTMAEKSIIPAPFSLHIGNLLCVSLGFIFFRSLIKK